MITTSKIIIKTQKASLKNRNTSFIPKKLVPLHRKKELKKS